LLLKELADLKADLAFYEHVREDHLSMIYREQTRISVQKDEIESQAKQLARQKKEIEVTTKELEEQTERATKFENESKEAKTKLERAVTDLEASQKEQADIMDKY
jgi:predicted transcriptional regulator